jgi:hypothetical protein
MNAQQQSKLENRLKEIESIYYNVDSDARHDLICERTEIEFQINKSNINFRLSGDNKYYYASHCKQFTDNLLKYGYGRKTPEEIKKTGISFHNHSINFGYSTYCDDLKRFETKIELLGFVIGYNDAISNLKNN